MVETEAKSKRGGWGGGVTPAAHVRRQLQSGTKPRRLGPMTLLDAVERLCERADKGRSLMQKYGLQATDIHVALLFRNGDGLIGSSTLPPPESVGLFIDKFEQMAGVVFLGICWWQTPPDEWGAVPMWIEAFNPKDKRAALELLLYKEAVSDPSGAAFFLKQDRAG
jgi:hypothetical protein